MKRRDRSGTWEENRKSKIQTGKYENICRNKTVSEET